MHVFLDIPSNYPGYLQRRIHLAMKRNQVCMTVHAGGGGEACPLDSLHAGDESLLPAHLDFSTSVTTTAHPGIFKIYVIITDLDPRVPLYPALRTADQSQSHYKET